MAELSFWANAVVGGFSGIVVDAVLFPLDTIKTRLQQRKLAGVPSSSVRNASFYRGLVSAMAVSFPGAATYWSVYEWTKRVTEPLLGSNEEWRHGLRNAACAATADVTVLCVRNPFEVVKQQMQAGLHKSTADAVRSISRTGGLGGFYAGAMSTAVRDVPFSATQFALYEFMKGRLIRRRDRQLVFWENAGMGSIAGGVAAAVTTPLDVIKTRLMTQVGTSNSKLYTGWRDAFSTILREEGAGALLSGLVPRVAWISLGGAIFIGSFEELRRFVVPRPSQT